MAEGEIEMPAVAEKGIPHLEKSPWMVPETVSVLQADGIIRSTHAVPQSREVFSANEPDVEPKPIGTIQEYFVQTEPGTKSIQLDFRLQGVNKDTAVALTHGWHTWSGPTQGQSLWGQSVGMTGINDQEDREKIKAFLEPGKGGEKLPEGTKRSYGLVSFRSTDGTAHQTLGVVPGLDAIEYIEFKQDGGDIVVSVTKNLEGVTTGGERKISIFLADGKVTRDASGEVDKNSVSYRDLITSFAQEIGKKARNLHLMKDRAIGFSWASYGPGVTQGDIEHEIQAGRGIFDTYVVDDGWESPVGNGKVDTNKFPDMQTLVAHMKEAGIKPGIWLAPFVVKPGSEIAVTHPDWLLTGPDGKPSKIDGTSVFQPKYETPQEVLQPVVSPYGLDISNPEAREYVLQRFLELSRLGFEVFKADFLSVAFAGEPSKRDKTKVENFRSLFEEVRRRITNEGRSVELIGCGGPMMESIGLFEGTRASNDSALPNLERMPFYGKAVTWLEEAPFFRTLLKKILTKTNTMLYRDSVATAARRSLLFRDSHGLIFDGIHLTDPSIQLDPRKKREDQAKTGGRSGFESTFVALKTVGVHNLFIGDSLVRSGEEGVSRWRRFISRFKSAPTSSQTIWQE